MAVPLRIPVAKSPKAPAPPKAGGHYVQGPKGQYWNLIHAIGKNKWSPGLPEVTSHPSAPKLGPKPADPAIGGHYVKMGNKWQLIHATGPGKWAPGPVPKYGPGLYANNPIFNPNAALSGKNIYDAAKGLADVQTVGPMQDLTSQIAANDRQTLGTIKNTGGYFNQLGTQANQGVAAEQANANALNQSLSGISGQTQQALQGVGQNATATLQQYAPQGEGGLAAPAISSLAAEIARQQGLSAQQTGSAQQAGALQSANYGGLMASQLGTQALAGTQAIRGIAQSGTVENQPLQSKIAGLQASRGAILSNAINQIRQQEISNQLAKTTLQAGVTKTKITQAGETARTQATIKAANLRNLASLAAAMKRQQAGDASRKDIALIQQAGADKRAAARKLSGSKSSGGSGGSGSTKVPTSSGGVKGLSTAGANALIARIQKVSGHIQSVINFYTSQGYSLSKAQQLAYHGVKNGTFTGAGGQTHAVSQEADPVILNAALNITSGRSGLTSGDIKALHNMGLFNVGSLRPGVTPQSRLH